MKHIDQLKQLLSLAEEEQPDPIDIDVEYVIPEDRDHERAKGLRWRGSTFKGNNEPFDDQAKKMAKSIKDHHKLVRRAKAVYAEYGDPREPDNYTGYFRPGGQPKEGNVFHHFEKALKDKGFTDEQIEKIKKTSGERRKG